MSRYRCLCHQNKSTYRALRRSNEDKLHCVFWYGNIPTYFTWPISSLSCNTGTCCLKVLKSRLKMIKTCYTNTRRCLLIRKVIGFFITANMLHARFTQLKRQLTSFAVCLFSFWTNLDIWYLSSMCPTTEVATNCVKALSE